MPPRSRKTARRARRAGASRPCSAWLDYPEALAVRHGRSVRRATRPSAAESHGRGYPAPASPCRAATSAPRGDIQQTRRGLSCMNAEAEALRLQGVFLEPSTTTARIKPLGLHWNRDEGTLHKALCRALYRQLHLPAGRHAVNVNSAYALYPIGSAGCPTCSELPTSPPRGPRRLPYGAALAMPVPGFVSLPGGGL